MLREEDRRYPFIFYLIGILASLRAVQHALMNYDRTLSKEHERLIDEWKKNTAPETSPELDFIKTSRNRILKGADLAARAIYSEYCDRRGIEPGDHRHELN